MCLPFGRLRILFIFLIGLLLFVEIYTSEQTTTDSSAEVICGNLSCAPHSICESDKHGATWCDCHEGFLGDTCHEDRNECAMSNRLCMYRGECVNTPGSFRCACLSGWEGQRCQQRDESVTEVRCLAGFTGSKCEVDIDECYSSPNVCNPHQSCTNTRGSYTCTCIKGWTGVDCADDVNECDVTTTCQNGGTCTNLAGKYKCHCAHGWIGHNCEDDIDECDEGRCLHGSTCTNLIGSFSCTCPPEWSGDTCDILPITPPVSVEQTRGSTSIGTPLSSTRIGTPLSSASIGTPLSSASIGTPLSRASIGTPLSREIMSTSTSALKTPRNTPPPQGATPTPMWVT